MLTRDRGTYHHIQCREEHHPSVDLATKLPLWLVWAQKKLSVGMPEFRVSVLIVVLIKERRTFVDHLSFCSDMIVSEG